VVVEPLSGNFSHIADWPGDTLVFTDDGAEAAQIPIVNTTMEVNDTILIGITSISGGKFPAIGPKREFNLIIRPAEGSGTGITSDYFVRELKLSPNPAGHYIRIETRTGTAFDRLRVFDLSGQMLMDRPYLQEKEVEISGLGSGMYLMHLDGPAGRYLGKFIKR